MPFLLLKKKSKLMRLLMMTLHVTCTIYIAPNNPFSCTFMTTTLTDIRKEIQIDKTAFCSKEAETDHSRAFPKIR